MNLARLMLACTLAATLPAQASGWRVGVGMSDLTGEAAEVGMMGYAELSQQTSRPPQRPRARALVV